MMKVLKQQVQEFVDALDAQMNTLVGNIVRVPRQQAQELVEAVALQMRLQIVAKITEKIAALDRLSRDFPIGSRERQCYRQKIGLLQELVAQVSAEEIDVKIA